MSENTDKFKHNDRFFTVHWTGEIKYGTVLHHDHGHMYGNPAVYMVNYDDPEMKEHNENEKDTPDLRSTCAEYNPAVSRASSSVYLLLQSKSK
jgi:hypothetical protein